MNLSELSKKIESLHPELTLKKSDNFYWSPAEATVYYRDRDDGQEAAWALLHESGHGLLGHTQYFTDIELVVMESEAWERAKLLGKELNLSIDEEHIQDCLDSYRDWLHKRSLCPDCHLSGIQTSTKEYTCVFCNKSWRVTAERFCRPYRRRAT
jgi:hypothetical protein